MYAESDGDQFSHLSGKEKYPTHFKQTQYLNYVHYLNYLLNGKI